MLAENHWRTFGENAWRSVGENTWRTMGENLWRIIARKLTLRHSFANYLLSADVPVTTIQKLLGHRWLETTQIYVAANDRQVAADYYAACEKLEGWS